VWIFDTFFLKYTTFLNSYVALGFRIPLGAVLLVISGYLAQTGLSIVFGEKREKPIVIRKSVFNIVRHPIYLSEIVLYCGLLMLSISLAAFVVLLMAIVFLYYISRYEERLLLARFWPGVSKVHAGSAYVDPAIAKVKNSQASCQRL